LWTELGRSISGSFVSLIMFAAGEYRGVRQDRHCRVVGRAADGRPELVFRRNQPWRRHRRANQDGTVSVHMMTEERSPIGREAYAEVVFIPSPRRRRRRNALGCGEHIILCCSKIRRCNNAGTHNYGGGQNLFQSLHLSHPLLDRSSSRLHATQLAWG
jgi:hypothetical protein